MGRVEANNEIETPKPGESGEPVASQPPPQYQGVKDVQPPSPSQPIGAPWSTGLFDCHLNQTNGNYSFSSFSLLMICFGINYLCVIMM